MADHKNLGESIDFDHWAEVIVKATDNDGESSREYNLMTYPVSRVVWTRDAESDIITITLYPRKS